MSDVLLNGKPMTREALVAVWRGHIPYEFDVAEGLLDREANALARWCDECGIPVKVRYGKVKRIRRFTLEKES